MLPFAEPRVALGTLAQMSPPEPMLSASFRSWPRGSDWVLQPKWDGFRLLIEVAQGSSPRAWSRHGTSLTSRLADFLEPFGTFRAARYSMVSS